MFKVRIVVGISYPHTNFAKTTPKFPKVGIQPIHVLNTLVLIGTIIQFSNMWYLLIEWINCESYGLITFLFTEWFWSKVGRFCPKSASARRPLVSKVLPFSVGPSGLLHLFLSSYTDTPHVLQQHGNVRWTYHGSSFRKAGCCGRWLRCKGGGIVGRNYELKAVKIQQLNQILQPATTEGS